MRPGRFLLALGLSAGLVLPSPAGAGPTPSAPPPAPPPTPVPPDGSPSPYPTALATPSPSARPPSIDAAAAALGDLDTGEVLWERRGDARLPIASVTKIMTALLVLESVPPEETVTATPNAAAQSGAELGLEAGEELPVRQLLHALMLQSANDAAVALAEHVAGSVGAFVELMNDRAGELRLRDTRFASPNGLDDSGYSSARDLVRLTGAAYRQPALAQAAAARFRSIPDPDGGRRRIQNRNALLWLYAGAIGVKTGYTDAAGFCLVAAAERDRLRLVAVVLGAPTEAFSAAAAMLDHGFAVYERRTVVQADQPFEPIEVDGRAVPVSADVSLDVRLRSGEEVDLEVFAEPGLSLPIAAGDRIGVVEVSAEGGVSLGEVPLVADRAVRAETPEAEDDRPWWERAWDAAAGFFTRVFRAIFG